MTITPHEYIVNFIKKVKEHSIRNADWQDSEYGHPPINWKTYERQVLDMFNNNPPDHIQSDRMRDLISQSLQALQDGHSHLPRGNYGINYANAPTPETDSLHGEHLENTAYLLVPRELEVGGNFKQKLRQKVMDLDHVNLSGWVIDLRASYGGGVWETLDAIWPFMPQDEPAGYFLNPHDDPMPWGPLDLGYPDKLPNYKLKSSNTPIAVLIGNGTSSAGEFLTVMFRGLHNTRSFGQTTDGRTTGNAPIELLDGQKIALTVSIYADRTKQVFGNQIQPDVSMQGNYDHLFNGNPVFKNGFEPKKDTLIRSARIWISQYNASHQLQPEAEPSL